MLARVAVMADAELGRVDVALAALPAVLAAHAAACEQAPREGEPAAGRGPIGQPSCLVPRYRGHKSGLSGVAGPLARAAEWPRRQAHPPSLPWPRGAGGALASPDKQHATTPPAHEPPAQATPVDPVKPTTVAVLNATTVTRLDRVLSMTADARVFADRADIAVVIGADHAK
jgi:hypothetical protein